MPVIVTADRSVLGSLINSRSKPAPPSTISPEAASPLPMRMVSLPSPAWMMSAPPLPLRMSSPRAADEGVGIGRAVEGENAGDGLACQTVGACVLRRDAERSRAAIQARDRVEVGQLCGGEKNALHAAGEIKLLHVGDGGAGVHVAVAHHQLVVACAAIDGLAGGHLVAVDEDGVVAVSGLNDVGSPLAAEDVVARAADESVGTRRAVERQNAVDGLALKAVGACEFRRDAERRPAAVLVCNGFEVGQLLGGEKDVLHTAVEDRAPPCC